MKKILSLFSLICLLFTMSSLTAFAAQEPSVIVTESRENNDALQPRFPGLASVTRVTIYPKKMNENAWYNTPTVVYDFGAEALGQTEYTTINDKTMKVYTENGCDRFRVEATLDRTGADFYEIYINGEFNSRSYMVSTYPYQTFYMNIPVIDGKATWEIVLSTLGEDHGKPFTHFISLQE